MKGKSAVPDMTVDEMVATLKRSFLPTVIIEGKDDVIIFRRLEEVDVHLGLSIFPVGGRKNVLEIFDRKEEFLNSGKIAFIADRDMWVIETIPEKYISNDLLFTHGYSIENDVYVDGSLENLLFGDEKKLFFSELSKFVHWYALALSRLLKGEDSEISLHPNHLLDSEEQRLRLTQLRSTEIYPIELKSQLMLNYKQKLRGKSLLFLLQRQISRTGRSVRHNDKSLLENVATARGALIDGLFCSVIDYFTNASSRSAVLPKLGSAKLGAVCT